MSRELTVHEVVNHWTKIDVYFYNFYIINDILVSVDTKYR
jgi:hypothetical protein